MFEDLLAKARAAALPVPAAMFYERMLQRGVLPGVPIPPRLAGHDRALLVAVTETRSQVDIDLYVSQAASCGVPGAP